MRWYLPIFALAGTLLASSTSAWATDRLPNPQSEPDWPYPLLPGPLANPVLTRYEVTDAPAGLVADPFLVRKDGLWYMFFEVYAWPGVISVATSLDGYDWTYDRVVLEEDTHISYPCVFSHDNGQGEHYYMVVESGATQSVPLYRSLGFPYQWFQVAVLASGREFADPTILRWNGTWWMFVSRAYSDVCYLYYSDNLESGWIEHPQSPIAQGRAKSRPAGRFMVIDGTRIVRLAQKSDVHYGEAVRAFEVDVLTRTAYAEHELPDSPILTASGQGWNAEGMHHCDEQWTGTHWLAGVDGFAAGCWSIGIYSRDSNPAGAPTSSPATPASSRPLSLRTFPNPVRAGQPLHLVLDGAPAGRPVSLEMTDVTGRSLYRTSPAGLIARREDDGSSPTYTWAATDPDGRGLPPGIYMVRVASGCPVTTQQTKVVVIR